MAPSGGGSPRDTRSGDDAEEQLIKLLKAQPILRQPTPLAQSTPQEGPDGPPQRRKTRIPHAYDERCYCTCKQSNSGRLYQRPPLCRMWCYYKSSVPPSEQVRFLAKQATVKPGQVNASTMTTTKPNAQSNVAAADLKDKEAYEAELARLTDKYSINWLKGKYLYFAEGEPMVIRHLQGMRRWENVEAGWFRQQAMEREAREAIAGTGPKSKALAAIKTLQPVGQGALVVTPWFNDVISERTISLAETLAQPVARFHLHLVRIYSPAWTRVSKLPQILWRQDDGKPSQNWDTLTRFYEKAVAGEGYHVATRAFSSVFEVLSRISAKYEQDSRGRPGGPSRPPPSSGGGEGRGEAP